MQTLRRVASRRSRTVKAAAPSESTASLASAASTVSSTSGSDPWVCVNGVDGVSDWATRVSRRKSAPATVQPVPSEAISDEEPIEEDDYAGHQRRSDGSGRLNVFPHVTVRSEIVHRLAIGSVLVGSELESYAPSAWSGGEVSLVGKAGNAIGCGQALMPGNLICGSDATGAVEPCMASSPCVLVTSLTSL